MKLKAKDYKLFARQALNGNWMLACVAQILIVLIYIVFFSAVAILFMKSVLDMTLGRTGAAFIATVIGTAFVGVVLVVVAILLEMGLRRLFLNLVREGDAEIKDLLFGFQNLKGAGHYVGCWLAIFLGTILLNQLILFGLETVWKNQFGADRIVFDFLHPELFSFLFYLLEQGIVLIVSWSISTFFGMALILITDHPQLGCLAALNQSVILLRKNRLRQVRILISMIGISVLAMLTFGIGYLWVLPYMMVTEIFFYLDLQGEISVMQERGVKYAVFGNAV